ncbi:MAG: GMC family oxidoreductase [Sphingomonadales bacterium]|nr:GMC family oxidoreductase [Sphingomonadales bacterium]
MSGDFDAIIVGSGMSGGWVAKELTERGLKVVVLERGRNIDPTTDYRDFDNPWELENGNKIPQEEAERDYAIQSQWGGFNTATKHLWVKDSEHPYTTPKDKPFLWIRGYHVGGRSLMWARQSYRLSDIDFEANKKDGHGVDWPIRYADLAPWYDHVETFAGISGTKEGLPQLPDGQFLKPMGLNCVEQDFANRVAQAFDGRKVIPGRNANLSEVTKIQESLGRGACQFRNYCARGCSFGAYFSSVSATLPAAKQTGLMTLVPNAVVMKVITDPKTGRAAGVQVVDSVTKKPTTYTARMVFLNASAITSAQILLNSANEAAPRGLANSSDQLGRNLMDHLFGISTAAEVSGFEDRTTFGRRPNGLYIPRFRNLDDEGLDFVRGYGYQGSISRKDWERGSNRPGIGGEWKDSLAGPGGWQLGISGFGEMLPYAHNRVTLNPAKKDAWGMPIPHIECEHGENERKMAEKISADAREMCEKLGYKVVHSNAEAAEPGKGIHEMGTVRMGRDPKTSVLNAWNQSHDIPNLFCTDGGAMTSSACQNPSLTYMALSARASAHAVELLQEGKI